MNKITNKRDGSGKVSLSEIRHVFESLHVNVTDDELKRFVESTDSNSDGEIDYDEFVNAFGDLFSRKLTRQELKQAFDYMDKDRTGYLNINEIENVYKQLNLAYTKHGLLKLFEEIDLDHDANISFDELVRYFELL